MSSEIGFQKFKCRGKSKANLDGFIGLKFLDLIHVQLFDYNYVVKRLIQCKTHF